MNPSESIKETKVLTKGLKEIIQTCSSKREQLRQLKDFVTDKSITKNAKELIKLIREDNLIAVKENLELYP